MKTIDILKAFLKSTALATGTTIAAEGGTAFYTAASTMATSFSTDGNICLQQFTKKAEQDVHRVLYTLLAFAPAFLFSALYFLSKARNRSDYETLEESDSQSPCIAFFRNLFSAQNPIAKTVLVFLGPLMVGLSLIGIVYTPVMLALGGPDKRAIPADQCHDDIKSGDALLLVYASCILAVSLVIGLTCATFAYCDSPNAPSTSNPNNNTPAGKAATLPRLGYTPDDNL